MNITPTRLPEVLIVEPQRFGDERGFFVESYQANRYADVGIQGTFVQDNMSRSCKGVLRGLHYQIENPQGKLVQVIRGAVYDVAVDMREDSPNFGKWVGVLLTSENGRQLWVPPGFAHGFCVVSPEADFFYKCTDFYSPEHERAVNWNDPELGIKWPISNPIVSAKDQVAPNLADADRFQTFKLARMLQEVDRNLNETKQPANVENSETLVTN